MLYDWTAIYLLHNQGECATTIPTVMSEVRILTINSAYLRQNYGAVIFTLIMTTRILLSIALSCILYGHQVSATGFFGLMLVLSAVLYRIRRKAQGQQLLKWQGMEDGTKTFELVQEWHEHVEM
jgi:UAA transporter family